MAKSSVKFVGGREFQIKLDKTAMAIARNSRLMGQIGDLVNTRIKERTAKGIGADNEFFAPYSKGYKRLREKEGRPVEKVDLNFTGSMFSSMTHIAKNDQVTSFFMSTVDRFGARNSEKAFFNQELRNFFAINAEDVVEIETVIKKYISRKLKGAR